MSRKQLRRINAERMTTMEQSLFDQIRQDYTDKQRRAEKAEAEKAEQQKIHGEMMESLKAEIENDVKVLDDAKTHVDLFDAIDAKRQTSLKRKKEAAISEREAEEEKERKRQEKIEKKQKRAEKFAKIFGRKSPKKGGVYDGKPTRS